MEVVEERERKTVPVERNGIERRGLMIVAARREGGVKQMRSEK